MRLATDKMFSTAVLYFLILLRILNANVLYKEFLRIAIWNSSSGLELKEVCQNDKMDILILEGLRVKSMSKGKSHCLKMLPVQNQKFFPHAHRQILDKGKGAVYADYLEVSELGQVLDICKQRNVKVLIQVEIRKQIKLTRRQTILMSVLLWNSFLSSSYYYDRPFGADFVFDGIHFVHDSGTLNISHNLMKKIRNISEFEDRRVILSSESSDIKNVPSESDFVITTASSINAKSAPKDVPFVIRTTVDELKTFEEFIDYKMFKGFATKLNETSRLTILKYLMTRNSSIFRSGLGFFTVLLALIFILSLFLFVAGCGCRC